MCSNGEYIKLQMMIFHKFTSFKIWMWTAFTKFKHLATKGRHYSFPIILKIKFILIKLHYKCSYITIMDDLIKLTCLFFRKKQQQSYYNADKSHGCRHLSEKYRRYLKKAIGKLSFQITNRESGGSQTQAIIYHHYGDIHQYFLHYHFLLKTWFYFNITFGVIYLIKIIIRTSL